jgi:hypothetical protein
MATATKLGSATGKLTGLIGDATRYDIAHADLLAIQIEAADEIFQDRLGRIRLLQNRAGTGGVTAIRHIEDIVPVLFAHTTYKSYPETWLTERRWDRLGKWLDTVSADRVEDIDLDGVGDFDDWLGRLEARGHFVSCSSGTTGKSAMMNATADDLRFGSQDTATSVAWSTGVDPSHDRRVFALAPVAKIPRNDAVKRALADAYALPDVPLWDLPVPPITVGRIAGMVALRKSIADGTAQPEDIARYEAESASRQAAIDGAVIVAAEQIVAARGEKLLIIGMWTAIHRIAELVRGMGYGAGDFSAENMLYVGGGLKGAVLPADYRDYIYGTFNIRPHHIHNFYGMQELNTTFPKCPAGRYHCAPWVIPLLLDDSGDNLIAPRKGEQEGRAAFFDLSLQGRWNGVISGDKVAIDYGPCACGAHGPSIADTVVRYSDLAGGDKISCSGTIDAYVRGVA